MYCNYNAGGLCKVQNGSIYTCSFLPMDILGLHSLNDFVCGGGGSVRYGLAMPSLE